MRRNPESITGSLGLLPAILAVVAMGACSNSHNEFGSASGSANEPAALAIDTVTATDTVKSIDYGARTVTLENPNGTIETYRASPDMVNFNQIQVGDRVRATVAEALAISVRKAGIPPNVGDAFAVSLAPKGTKPGMFVANTEEATCKIMDINRVTRTITLEGPADGPKKIDLAPGVDVSDLKKGDDVVMRYTDALALRVEKQ
jgi:Cu/Ag efflux protein CusF